MPLSLQEQELLPPLPQPLQPEQPQPQDEPPFFLLRMMERMQKNSAAAISKSTIISVMLIFLLLIPNPVQIPPINEACLLQSLYHPVHGSDSHRLILLPDLIIDLLTAGAVVFQYDTDNQLSLLCDPKSLLLQTAYNHFLTHPQLPFPAIVPSR